MVSGYRVIVGHRDVKHQFSSHSIYSATGAQAIAQIFAKPSCFPENLAQRNVPKQQWERKPQVIEPPVSVWYFGILTDLENRHSIVVDLNREYKSGLACAESE